MMRLFPYFGTKARMAARYPAPIYRTIVEPFAGAAAYSCQWPDRNVILYDLYDKIAAVHQFLIDASPEDILNLPIVPPGKTVDDFDLSPAEKWFIGFWVNMASSSPCKQLSTRGKQNFIDGSIASWASKRRQIAAANVTKIKHWKVYNASYKTIDVGAIGSATWFVDPPYQIAGQRYVYGSDQINYKKLGEWCRNLPGQVIVCENAGADWLPFRFLCKQSGTSFNKQTEVIWTKGCDIYPSLMSTEAK
jgi:site-specific DNA-adenine methylase